MRSAQRAVQIMEIFCRDSINKAESEDCALGRRGCACFMGLFLLHCDAVYGVGGLQLNRSGAQRLTDRHQGGIPRAHSANFGVSVNAV